MVPNPDCQLGGYPYLQTFRTKFKLSIRLPHYFHFFSSDYEPNLSGQLGMTLICSFGGPNPGCQLGVPLICKFGGTKSLLPVRGVPLFSGLVVPNPDCQLGGYPNLQIWWYQRVPNPGCKLGGYPNLQIWWYQIFAPS